jgi:hypothetical protein
MRNRLFGALISLAFVPLPSSLGSSREKPIKSAAPLSADEIAIYRGVLQEHRPSDSAPRVPNVAVRLLPQLFSLGI